MSTDETTGNPLAPTCPACLFLSKNCGQHQAKFSPVEPSAPSLGPRAPETAPPAPNFTGGRISAILDDLERRKIDPSYRAQREQEEAAEEAPTKWRCLLDELRRSKPRDRAAIFAEAVTFAHAAFTAGLDLSGTEEEIKQQLLDAHGTGGKRRAAEILDTRWPPTDPSDVEARRRLRVPQAPEPEGANAARGAFEPDEVSAASRDSGSTPDPARPARSARSLPKTADGDTLLVLPDADRDVPPELASEKRWLIWTAEWDAGKNKFKKPPRSPFSGEKIGATEKYREEFTTFAEARAAAERFEASGVGIVFLAGDGLVGIDFDHCIIALTEDDVPGGGHARSNSPAIDPETWLWLDKWFTNTYQEASPGGDGIHVIGRGKIPKAAKAALPNAPGVGVELYDNGRFFTFSAQRFSFSPQPVADCQASIDKLLACLGERTAPSAEPSDGEQPMSRLTARRIHQDNLQSLRCAREGEGNSLLNSVSYFAARACAAGALDGAPETIQQELFDIVTKDWKSPHPAHGARRTIQSGWATGSERPLTILEEKWPEVAALIEEFNRRYFTTLLGSKFRICEIMPAPMGTRVRQVLCPIAENDFVAHHRGQNVQTGGKTSKDADGKIITIPKLENRAKVWLESAQHRRYEKVIFEPGGNPSRWDGAYNLWNGFAFKPTKGDSSLYLAHLRENVCQNDEAKYNWLIRWMAWQVRHPEQAGQSAVVVHGLKGVGKNVFAEGFADLWGQHMLVANSERLVMGNFNAHLRDLCVLVADEAFYAKDPYQVNRLKTYVTGSTLLIEGKGLDVVEVPNRLRIIIIGNDDHIVHATNDERRYFVLECGEARRNDTKYFSAIARQLQQGGYAALLYHLMYEVDLSGFEVRNPPHTEELRQQMAESLTGAEGAWLECLYRGELPGRVEKDGTAWLRGSDFVRWANNQGRQNWRGLSVVKLGLLLGNNPRGKDKGGMGFGKGQTTLFDPGQRSQGWRIPTLCEARATYCRKRFAQAWDDDVTEWREVGRDD